MSKVVMSLPEGILKRSFVGGIIALAAYVVLQFLCAFLIHKEILSPQLMYQAVCISAAIASFLGCGYSVVKGRSAMMLSVSAVIVVFLALTVAVALFAAESISVERGLTGVGLSMAAGGLASALIGGNLPRGRKTGYKKKKRRKS